MKSIAQLIEDNRTPSGGWTKDFLASIGVSWPPSKGWKNRAINGFVSLFCPCGVTAEVQRNSEYSNGFKCPKCGVAMKAVSA